jgi:hypothetical protein
MNRAEQKGFVREMSKTIADDICAFIDEGRIPEDWDGHEFLVLLASRHSESADMSSIRRHPQRKRAGDFRNHCMIMGL